MDLKEIREQINKLGTDLSELLAKARTENRELSSEEETQFDKIDADRERLMATERRMAKVAELDGSAGRQTERTQPTQEGRRTAGRTSETATVSQLDRIEAMRGWMLASGKPELVTPEQRHAAQRCGISLDQRQLTLRLAPIALTSVRPDEVRDWEQRLTQVDTVSPDLGGHYTVPNETMRSLEVALLAFGGMRDVADVQRTNTGADLPIPTTNDTANEGAILGEGLEATELDVEFAQLVLNAYKYTSRRVGMSVEYLQDNAINAAQRIGSILGERIARITNRHFTVGTGNSQPKGIVTAATSSGVTTASATEITYDELIDLKHSVDPSYRALGARYMFNDTTLKLLKKIKVPQYSGDTAGQPLWRAGMAVGQPDTIDGDPYTINQHMPAPTAGLKSVVYGYLRKYVIRDVRDITLVRLDERYAELGIVAFLAFSRHDGDLLDAGTHPVKYLTMHA